MSQGASQKPEEHELELKRSELAIIEAELNQRELELATVQASLHTFEQRSKAELDPRYEELANLQHRLAELRSKIKPAEGAQPPPSTRKTPKAPRKRRPRPESPTDLATSASADEKALDTPERLKRMYRDVAKAIHPDLAGDDIERQHRHALMVKANEAYDAGDEQKLSGVLYEWDTSPEAIRGQGSIPDLIRTIRKIHRGKLRLAMISMEMTRLTGTSLYNLKHMADEAKSFERDLLAEMTERIDQQIAETKQQIADLEKILPPEALEPNPVADPQTPDTPAAYEPVYVQTFDPDPPSARD
jgi:hypothetical protein